jgi:ribulose-phosphate 3-epimerase
MQGGLTSAERRCPVAGLPVRPYNATVIRVAPSILSADFGRLAEEVRAVTNAGADWIHVDVMDGHFVPNLTLGPDIVGAIDRATDLPLDVHLMIEHPERYVERFIENGADYVSVHREVVADAGALFDRIEAAGAKPGIVINPDTPVATLGDALERAALVLVMSVNPGFGAQPFMEVALPKLTALRELREQHGYGYILEVDGGVKTANVQRVIDAGADVVVAGSAVFKSNDYAATIHALRGK